MSEVIDLKANAAAETALTDGRLRQAQLKMLAMLEIIDVICKKYELNYWLDAGTLLGAIRHKGFIPWDDDMDIAMPRACYEKFLKIAPQELPAHMWLQTAQTDRGYFNMATPLKIRDRNSYYVEKHEHENEPYMQGIFIDVFVYDSMPENPGLRKYYKFKAKKLSRILSTKCSKVKIGHYASFYKALGKCIPRACLEGWLAAIIRKTHKNPSIYIGRGFQCVGKNLLKQDEIYPLQHVPFETGMFPIPQNAHDILTQQYGDYTSLPPEHQRTLRHCKKLIPHLESADISF